MPGTPRAVPNGLVLAQQELAFLSSGSVAVLRPSVDFCHTSDLGRGAGGWRGLLPTSRCDGQRALLPGLAPARPGTLAAVQLTRLSPPHKLADSTSKVLCGSTVTLTCAQGL